MGFFRQEYWSRLSCHPPGDPPDLGIKLVSLMSPALVSRFFITSTTWEAPSYVYTHTHTHIYIYLKEYIRYCMEGNNYKLAATE